MPRIESVEAAGSEYIIYGHEHSYDALEDEMTDIKAYMDAMDAFGLETIGYQPDMSVHGSRFHEDYHTYTGRLLAEAGERLDTAYGPDAKSPMPIMAGLLTAAGASGYMGARHADDIYDRIIGDEEQITMDRRDLLAGAAGLLGTYSTGGFDALFPDGVQETIDRTPAPVSTTYGDIRDITSAEGLAAIEADTVFTIVGKAHTSSIATYLEEPTMRAEKYDTYSHLIPDWQTYLTRWEQDDSQWILEKAAPAPDW